jgi:hypothetical protein
LTDPTDLEEFNRISYEDQISGNQQPSYLPSVGLFKKRGGRIMADVTAAVDETRSFMKSRIILTAVELDFFTHLDEKSRSASELAKDKQLDVRATTRVLDCLVAFGLLEKKSGVYKPSGKGSLYSAHHPETIRPMVRHMNHLWNIWSELTDVVKTGGDSEAGSGLQLDAEDWKSFIGAMHVSGRTLAEKVAGEYDLTRFKRLLDVGGASGTYTIAFLRRNPAMTAVLFDLENVIPMANERLAEEKIKDRVIWLLETFTGMNCPEVAISHWFPPSSIRTVVKKTWNFILKYTAL